MPLLQVQEVTKIFRIGQNEVRALDRVSLTLGEGEFVALQGTSGSGKSTLLNICGGLDRPSSGEILFDGRPIGPLTKHELARYRRHSTGIIFQNFNLIPSMTATENVELALAFGGVKRSERNRRARLLLQQIGLSERTEHRPAELSGGEQQRVAIARALANEPRMLLADEPTGNLDSQRAVELLAHLREIVSQHRLTVILVTHDRELAARFADRILHLTDGRLDSG